MAQMVLRLKVSATPVTDVANGTLVLNTDGTFTYTPDANFNGVDRFVYTLDDGNGGTDTASVRITVTAVNDAPVAADDTFTGDEDTDITGDVLADNGAGTDADIDGDALTVSATLVANVANGALTLNTDGTFTYTPDANFNGTDSFVYTLEDGQGGTDTATVTLTVNAVNDAPVALNDLFTTLEDNAVSGDVLADNGVNPDRDIEGDTLTVSATPVTDVANGTLVLNTDGTFTYTPDANFNGVDRFVYTLEDGNGGTDTAAVRITVTPVNDAPTIGAAVRAAPFEDDAPITVDLLDGAADADGDTLNISNLFLIAGDDSGVTVNGNTLEIDPSAYNSLQAGALETLRYRYDVSDGGENTRQSAIINIRGVNDAPTAPAAIDVIVSADGRTFTGNLLNGAADPDGDTIIMDRTPVDAPDNGALIIQANGDFIYTPDEGFGGQDSFIFQVLDGNGGAGQGTVTLTVVANETVEAGPGNDVITGDGTTRVAYDEASTGSIFGDLNSGIIRGNESVGRDQVSGIFEVRGSQFGDTLFGTNANPNAPPPSQLIGTFESFEGMGGNDLIIGRGGQDRANYSQSPNGVNVHLGNGLASDDGHGGIDTLFGIEGIGGSRFDDILTGDGGDNFFEPLRGNDTVDGAGGNDLVMYRGALGDIVIDLRAGNASHSSGEVDTLISIEFAETGAGNDEITGDVGANALSGNVGNDRLIGFTGDDLLLGGLGNDVLFGNSGADLINGGAGNDRLFGSFGDDELFGGIGNDVLSGGDDADVFFFGPGSGIDTVTDFTTGTDVINVNAYGFADFAALSNLISDVNGRAQINLNGTTDVLRLNGVLTADLSEGDFVI